MRALLSALPLLLTACGMLPAWPEALTPTIPQALVPAFLDPVPVAEPDPPEAAAQDGDGTPSLRLSWDKGQALALLVQANGENRLWRSAGGVVVATDGARVVATAGLREWIASTRLDGPDPLDEPLALLGRSIPLRRQVDLVRGDRSPESMRFGVALTCRMGATHEGAAVLLRESCRGGGTGGFTNRYWADPASGGIYRSEQWVGEAGMMLVEVVTPPS